MDNRYYENVLEEMRPFLEEHSFLAVEDGCFSDGKKKISVNYDDARQMYTLSAADFNEEENTFGEMRELNAWLFDDTQNAKDAASVGIDFTVSLRKELGIKLKRTVSGDGVELPSASKSGNMTVTGFTKKMLDVYPILKDEYKSHIAVYGNFLYINFFGEHLVSKLNETLTVGTKKQIKKLFDVFEDAYVKGDRDTVNIMVALLCAASHGNSQAQEAVRAALGEDKHFLASYNNFIPVFAKNKKLMSALLK